MEINCASCGAHIPATDVNLERMVAKCATCNSVFDFSEQVAAAADAGRQRRRAPVDLPARMKVLVDDRQAGGSTLVYRHDATARRGDFIVERRWFEPLKHIFLLFFCVVWDGFLVSWYTGLTTAGAQSKAGGGPGLIFYLFPLLHVSVGVGLTYSVVAGFFNTTQIGIRGDDFFVHHGPIPWRGNRTLPARSVTQLFCQEKITKGENGVSRTYSLTALVDGGERLPLVSGLTEIEQALFLEQALEERLGIVDVEVAGELSA